MKIYFASDHAGFEMKKALVKFVKELGFEVADLGPEKLDPKDDYPVFMEKIGIEKAVLNTIHGYTASQSIVDGPNKKDWKEWEQRDYKII
ncbi:MAG: Ribose 5-phosphate isomerase [Parcubacteria group bacterium GW2011_GWB1_35_5]|nr:MAG: Ribose 5-phosphate isomerase [Parcubacteria group bacterium GW2011_GWB1_35_5]